MGPLDGRDLFEELLAPATDRDPLPALARAALLHDEARGAGRRPAGDLPALGRFSARERRLGAQGDEARQREALAVPLVLEPASPPQPGVAGVQRIDELPFDDERPPADLDGRVRLEPVAQLRPEPQRRFVARRMDDEGSVRIEGPDLLDIEEGHRAGDGLDERVFPAVAGQIGVVDADEVDALPRRPLRAARLELGIEPLRESPFDVEPPDRRDLLGERGVRCREPEERGDPEGHGVCPLQFAVLPRSKPSAKIPTQSWPGGLSEMLKP